MLGSRKYSFKFEPQWTLLWFLNVYTVSLSSVRQINYMYCRLSLKKKFFSTKLYHIINVHISSKEVNSLYSIDKTLGTWILSDHLKSLTAYGRTLI